MFYYIIKIKSNLIKVGITKDLTQRMKAYRTSDPLLSYHKTYELDLNKKETLRLEKSILNELKRWYQCRSETIESDNTRAIEMIVEGVMEDYELASVANSRMGGETVEVNLNGTY